MTAETEDVVVKCLRLVRFDALKNFAPNIAADTEQAIKIAQRNARLRPLYEEAVRLLAQIKVAGTSHEIYAGISAVLDGDRRGQP
jgi:hypothetical protein